MLSTRFFVLAVSSLALSVASAQIVPLTNDECVAAILVTDGVNPAAPSGQSGHVFTNVGSTHSQFPSGTPGCFAPAFTQDVWFQYVAPGTGTTVVSTCTPVGFSPGTLADSIIEVRQGACPHPSFIACNDDFCTGRSQLTFATTFGTTYYILVTGFFNAIGTFYLTVTGPPPPNDQCSGAIALSYGTNGPYSNVTALTNSILMGTCSLPSPGFRDLWFSLTATTCGPLAISTCGSPPPIDSVLQVYDSCGGVELACNDDTGGACGFASTVNLTTTIGTTYLIRVSSFQSNLAGAVVIDVTFPAATLAWSSPLGPGSLQAQIVGPPNGTFFLAVTLVAGNYPNGWLFGLDIAYAELASELGSGLPFTGALGACGSIAIGPFQGLPPGLTIYSLAFGFPQGAPVPSSHSPATSYTVP